MVRIKPSCTRFSYLAVLLVTMFFCTLSLQAQTFTTLAAFPGQPGPGGSMGTLVRDKAGNLYGTTVSGGISDMGSVFKLDTNNNLTTLHSFIGDVNGANPRCGLAMDAAGNLYGTTLSGGPDDGNGGTIFKIDTNNNFSVLHYFSLLVDGAGPTGNLTIDASGNLYGTTTSGGPEIFFGTLYKLHLGDNQFSVLHTFNSQDGYTPYGGVVRDASGNLYGATSGGGAYTWGTVFKIDTNGSYSVLHSLNGASDGGAPVGSLFLDAAGNLFGTTYRGGIQSGTNGFGTVFKLDTSNNFSVLYTFTGGNDGGNPVGGVAVDTAGNIYGTTEQSGTSGTGTAFKLDTLSNYSLLHLFNGGDGSNPQIGLTLDNVGNAYGTTFSGGSGGSGTIFKIGLPGAFNSPAKDSVLPPHTVTFNWSAGVDVGSYQLFLGTTPGDLDLGYVGTSDLHGTFSNVPIGGEPVYATLWGYSTTEGWLVLDAANYITGYYGQITSPASGSKLAGKGSFTWSPESGSPSYQFWLGSSPRSFDYGYVGTSDTQAYFANLPTDGRTIYATLWGYAAGNWLVQDTATYVAGSAGTIQITSPPKGSTLPGSTVTFTWSKLAGATYQLWAGSTPGGYDLGVSGTRATSTILYGLPTNGSTVYVTLWSNSGGVWTVQDTATYTAATASHQR